MKARGLIILLFSLIVLSTQKANNEDTAFEKKIDESPEQCTKQYNITDLPDNLTEEAAAKNKNLQCFVKCIYLKVNFINEAGVINVNEVSKHMQPYTAAQTAKLIAKCKDIKGADSCETAYKFSKCTGDELTEMK